MVAANPSVFASAGSILQALIPDSIVPLSKNTRAGAILASAVARGTIALNETAILPLLFKSTVEPSRFIAAPEPMFKEPEVSSCIAPVDA